MQKFPKMPGGVELRRSWMFLYVKSAKVEVQRQEPMRQKKEGRVCFVLLSGFSLRISHFSLL